jgi:hypothetical protein
MAKPGLPVASLLLDGRYSIMNIDPLTEDSEP